MNALGQSTYFASNDSSIDLLAPSLSFLCNHRKDKKKMLISMNSTKNFMVCDSNELEVSDYFLKMLILKKTAAKNMILFPQLLTIYYLLHTTFNIF